MGLFKNISNLLTFSRGRFPQLVQMYLSYQCNSRCNTCLYWKKEFFEKYGALTFEEAKSVVDHFSSWGTRLFFLTGGEPLMRPYALDLAEYIAGKDCSTLICTNGLSLTEEKIDRMARIPRLRVSVSLDGLSREAYEANRGLDALDKVMTNILRLRDKAPWKPRVFMTISAANFGEVEDVIAWCRREKIYFSGNPYFASDEGRFLSNDAKLKGTREQVEEMAAAIERVGDLAKRTRIVFGFSRFWKLCADVVRGKNPGPCGAGEDLLQITPNMKVTACNEVDPFYDLRKDGFENFLNVYRRKDWKQPVCECAANRNCAFACGYNYTTIKRHRLAFLWESIRSGKIFDYFSMFTGGAD